MKKIILLCLLISSCGFFKTNPNVDAEQKEAPPVVRSEKDPTKVLYNPDTSQPPVENNEDTEVCEYKEFTFIQEQIIYPSLVKDTWLTKSETITEHYDYQEFKEADYLHINRATLESIEGENLNFISWFKAEIASHPVIWSEDVYDPSKPRFSELNFDGSYDFAKALRPNSHGELVLEFVGIVRGKSPMKTTTLEMSLHLSSFYNCR